MNDRPKEVVTMARITPAAVSNVLIAAGVSAIAVALGALLGVWLGVLVGGGESVVCGWLIARADVALADVADETPVPAAAPVVDALADAEPLFPAAA